MGNRFLFKLTAFAVAMAMVVLGAGVALADVLTVNELNLAGDQSRVRGATGTVQTYLRVTDNTTDPVNGCNANDSSPVSVSFTSNDTSAIASPSSVSITACDNTDTAAIEGAKTSAYTVLSSAELGSTVTIAGDASGGKVNNQNQTGSFNESDTLKITVVPRPATALRAAADGQNAIDLSWTASADAADITDYVIYRDGSQVATAAKTATSSKISGLLPATNYCYTIKARYTSTTPTDFVSSAAGPACADTAAVASNTAPSIAAANSSVTVNEGTQATNSGTWSDNGDVTLTSSVGTVTKNPNGQAGTWSWAHTPGNETSASGQTVTITASDVPGLSTSTTFTLIANNVAPTTPGTPSVPSGTSPSGSGAYTVSWSASSDVAADTVTYTLQHQNGAGEWAAVATGLATPSYTFGGANESEPQGSWKYRVRATDGSSPSAFSSDSASVLVDKTGPSVEVRATKASGGDYTALSWTNGNVSVTFTCVDSGSGVNQSATNVTGSGTRTTSGTATSGGTCVDNAGNSVATADFPTFSVNIDKVLPTNVASAKLDTTAAPAYSAGAWTNQNVNVTFTCTDTGGSTLTETSGNSTVKVTETAASTAANNTCVDRAGNTAEASSFGAINIDRTLPTITAAATVPDGENTVVYSSGTWTNKTVTVSYRCGDEGGSGLASSPGCPTSDLVSDSTGITGVNKSGSVSDNAGNQTTSNVINVKVDKVAPTVTCPTAPVFTLNQGGPVAVTASVGDSLSGPKTTTASGAVDTSVLGTFTTEVTGEDVAGNTKKELCGYSVQANFTGWSAPINNPNYLNKMKAGQAVPFKWRLTDANGEGITTLAPSDVRTSVQGIGCLGSAPIDGVEEFAPGSSGLQNLGDGYYQLNWKSQSVYAGSCRNVTLDITGAGSRSAYFTFTK